MKLVDLANSIQKYTRISKVDPEHVLHHACLIKINFLVERYNLDIKEILLSLRKEKRIESLVNRIDELVSGSNIKVKGDTSISNNLEDKYILRIMEVWGVSKDRAKEAYRKFKNEGEV